MSTYSLTGNKISQTYHRLLQISNGEIYDGDGNLVTLNGSQGYQGPFGGPQGDMGSTGSQGYQGFQGITGSDGSAGSQGYQGFKGTTGSAGSQGYQGFQGITGSAGSAGSQGYQGFQGITGSAGSAGSQGYQGFQGITGSDGSAGGQGYQGFQGITGSAGSQGFQGTQGSIGTGLQGVQGPGSSSSDTISLVIDGLPYDISTGIKGYKQIARECIVQEWYIVSGQTGSIEFDIKKTTYANYPTGTSILNSSFLGLSGSSKDSNLSVDFAGLSASDIIEFNIVSNTGIKNVSLFLKINNI